MPLDLNTRIVTITPYNVIDTDTVIFVNAVGPASIILPATGDVASDILQQANQSPQSVLSLSQINAGLDNPSGLNPDNVHPNCRVYKSFYIKDFSGLSKTNPITITSAGGKTIDGSRFAILNCGYSHIQVVYDGTNWKTIA